MLLLILRQKIIGLLALASSSLLSCLGINDFVLTHPFVDRGEAKYSPWDVACQRILSGLQRVLQPGPWCMRPLPPPRVHGGAGVAWQLELPGSLAGGSSLWLSLPVSLPPLDLALLPRHPDLGVLDGAGW